jgi:type I restriction enzyme S subunit
LNPEQQSLSDIELDSDNSKKPYNLRRQSVNQPDSWNICSLGDLLELEYGTSLPKKERENGPYPVFGSNGRSGWHSDYHIEAPGIIVGRKGVNLGIKWSDKDFNVIDTAYFINSNTLNTTDLDLRFLYYNLLDFDLDRLKSGSAVPGLNRDEFYSETIVVPPITEQKKIAFILENLDRQIEVNNRINKNLEDVVQTLFTHQFVNFGPYDDFEDSPIGEVPKCFDILDMGDICSTRGGGTPSTENDEYWEGDNLWLTPKDVTSLNTKMVFDTTRKITDKGLNNSSTKIMPKKSVLLTSRATVGEVVVNREPMGTNQGFICIQPNERVETYYLSCLLKNKRPEIESRASGSTYDEISQTSFNEIKLAVPPKEDIERFENRVEDLYEEIYTRELQNRKLESLRDTLLPKLMSGEIRVNDINLEDLEVDNEV